MKGYRPEQAHRLAQNRKKERDRTRIPESTWARVEQLLREDWSPEQISGWLTREEGVSVSHERIYQHVYEDKRRGGDLHRHLRCQKPRRKRYGHYDRRGQIRERVSIDERPEVVEARSRIGDWEADTVIGKLVLLCHIMSCVRGAMWLSLTHCFIKVFYDDLAKFPLPPWKRPFSGSQITSTLILSHFRNFCHLAPAASVAHSTAISVDYSKHLVGACYA